MRCMERPAVAAGGGPPCQGGRSRVSAGVPSRVVWDTDGRVGEGNVALETPDIHEVHGEACV